MKSQPTKKYQEILGVSIVLSLLLMGNLHRSVAFGATALNLRYGEPTPIKTIIIKNRKIDLCGYHHPNYFARLVPEMGIFSKVLSRS